MESIGGFRSVRAHSTLIRNVLYSLYAAEVACCILLGVCMYFTENLWMYTLGPMLFAFLIACAGLFCTRTKPAGWGTFVIFFLHGFAALGFLAEAGYLFFGAAVGMYNYGWVLTGGIVFFWMALQAVFIILIGRYYGYLMKTYRRSESAMLLNDKVRSLLLEAQDQQWHISMDSVSLLKRVGAGGFGDVWKGTWNGSVVAVKKMHQLATEESLLEFSREASLLSVLRHPNIITFYGAACNEESLFLVTEYAERGSLYDLLNSDQCALPYDRRLRMALDTAKGMHYLHSLDPKVIHRDLKSPNLLVMKDYRVKVTDFGTSKLLDNMTMTNNVGSPLWSAPEVLRFSSYSEKADIYSFGIVLWELICVGEILFDGMMGFQIAIEVGTKGTRPPVPSSQKVRTVLLVA
eukprot:TRINITY_DN3506_c0_g1_i3.p1 TRINITY_DN3506_c0_g1~~TRINITY_DN3506_c0_g1_i3.p1  ORF type:complete len:405 (+),score=58.43 TRINITY_DN3506_c0_g1_i3:460-1674(+)